MSLQAFFAALSSLLGFAAVTPYILDIIARKTKPHSYSWLVWAILPTIGGVLVFNGGGGVGTIPFVVGALLCTTIFILSIRFGTKNVTRFDTICLIGAFGALVFYITTHDALISAILITCIDALATIPTMRKAYEEPETETVSTFAMSAISCFCGVLALSVISFVTALYLMSLILTNVILVSILLWRRPKARTSAIHS